MSRDQTPIKRLYRSNTDRIIAGVCGGLGQYFRVDPTIIRVIFVALAFAGGSGIFLYLILAFLTPRAPQEGNQGPENFESSIDFKKRADELAAELKNTKVPLLPDSGLEA